MRAGRGVVLDGAACRLLHALAVRGLAATRERDGGGVVPPDTAALLRLLATEGREFDDGSPEFVGPRGDGSAVSAVAAVQAASSEGTYSTGEAAVVWACTDSYVRRLCRLGVVKAEQTPDGWRIPRAVVLEADGPPRPSGKER